MRVKIATWATAGTFLALVILACTNPGASYNPGDPCPTPSQTLKLSDGHTYTCRDGVWK